MIRIEIVTIGADKIYSVGYIQVSKKGEVYYFNKVCSSDMHISRHCSGQTHMKSRQTGYFQKIREGISIHNFAGIEFLGTRAFGLNSLPELFSEYKMKKHNGLFAIDLREYKNSAFNMSIAIMTEEGLPQLYESWKKFKKRQIYLYTDCHPMIAITIADAKQT